jgi:hypothetical protein
MWQATLRSDADEHDSVSHNRRIAHQVEFSNSVVTVVAMHLGMRRSYQSWRTDLLCVNETVRAGNGRKKTKHFTIM